MAEERIIPAELDSDDPFLGEHVRRYELAAALLTDDDNVIDAGCGVGYGAALLGDRTGTVLGLDISQEAIDYAQEHYSSDRVRFRTADLEQEPVPACDVVVAFEFIEHIDRPEAFLEHALAAARRLVLVSTPIVPTTHRNQFHKHDWDVRTVERMLEPWVPVYSCYQSGADYVAHGVWVFAPAGQAARAGAELAQRNLEDQHEEFLRHHRLVKDLRDWSEELDKELEAATAGYAEDRAWLQGQVDSWRQEAAEQHRTVEERRQWIVELEAGKAWLQDQVDSWRQEAEEQHRIVEELRQWIVELEAGKAWLKEKWKADEGNAG